MIFKRHLDLEGQHAFLGASTYHWINYDEEKLIDRYRTHLATLKGTELHDLAAKLINNGIKLEDKPKTFNMYVNDAIGFNMKTEQVLYYSDYCFGTADSICFRNGELRIHDLKTGVTPAHMEQLFVYAALFCLEYKYKPTEIKIVLRLYQNDEVLECEPDIDTIAHIMDKIITFDKLIKDINREEIGS